MTRSRGILNRRLKDRAPDGQPRTDQHKHAVEPDLGRKLLDESLKARFIDLFPQHDWQLGHVCEMLNIRSTRVYRWAEEDEEFRDWYLQQQDLKIETMEEEGDKLAKGDAAMPGAVWRMFRLKGEFPGKYREKQAVSSGSDQPVRVELTFVPTPRYQPPQLPEGIDAESALSEADSEDTGGQGAV